MSNSNQSIYALSPPHGAITETDHGAYVVITTWIMMSLMVLSVGTRLMTRLIPIRTGGRDDIFIGIGMVVMIIESVFVHLAVNNGLGRHTDALSQSDFEKYSKFNYVTQILFILILWLSKISLLFFISRLTPSKETLKACWAVMGVVSAWAISFIIALATQCPLPRPYDFSNPSKCVNQTALYLSAGAVDIVTDLIIVALPCIIIWNVQITVRQRWTIISIFGVRLIVCALQAVRLSSLPHYLDSFDMTWDNVTPATWTQAVLFASLITSCIPCLRPFLSSLESGLLDSSMRAHMNKGSGNGNSYNLHSINLKSDPIISSWSNGSNAGKGGRPDNSAKPRAYCHPLPNSESRGSPLGRGSPYNGRHARSDSATLVTGGRNTGVGPGGTSLGFTRIENARVEVEGIIRQTTDFQITVENRMEHHEGTQWIP